MMKTIEELTLEISPNEDVERVAHLAKQIVAQSPTVAGSSTAIEAQYKDAILQAGSFLNVLDMLIDGVWIGLNMLGPMSFSYTTAQGHTVNLSLKAL